MITIRKICLGTMTLSFCIALQAYSAEADAEENLSLPTQPVVIDFFFEPGCTECFRVKSEVIPVLRDTYEGFYVLNEWDIGVEDNYVKLVAHLQRLNVHDNAHVFMIVDGTHVLAGLQEISANLFSFIDERLATGLTLPVPSSPVTDTSLQDREILQKQLQRFTLASVLAGGLIDGINPCAISTLVFMISVLSMSSIKGRALLLIGSSFCLASFLTYTAIGFGLLKVLYALSSFQLIRRTVDLVLVALLLGFSVFSFADAFRFKKNPKAEAIKLQLPSLLKDAIHRILRVGFGKKTRLISAFLIGAAVTALESVCTGQIYVPTLALVVKSRMAVMHGLSYLLLYNLMFILPLVAVFLLTYHGLKLTKLIEWSVRNVFVSKLLMGSFFLAVATILFLMP